MVIKTMFLSFYDVCSDIFIKLILCFSFYIFACIFLHLDVCIKGTGWITGRPEYVCRSIKVKYLSIRLNIFARFQWMILA